jgi:TolB protein
MVKLLRYNRQAQLGVVLLIAAAALVTGLVIEKRIHPCAPPNGKGDKIAFDNHQDIYVMDADGSHLCRLTFDAANNSSPAWSPDGKQLAFFSSRDRIDGIYVMQADGSNVRRLLAASHHGELGWSADGKHLAFFALYDHSELSIMDVDGSNVRRVTDRAVDGGVSWSPDGRSLAIVTWSGHFNQVAIVESDGSNLRIVADERMAGFADYRHPAWSPDGQRLALDNTEKVCLVNADGSNGHCLDVNPTNGNNQYPAWSPDSRRIAFVSYGLSAQDGIYVMQADGSNVSRLTKNVAFNLAWSP